MKTHNSVNPVYVEDISAGQDLVPNHKKNGALLKNLSLTILLSLLLPFITFASWEPTKTNKKNLGTFTIGDSLITSVQRVNNDTHQINRILNRITLGVCADTNLCYTDSFTFTALFKVLYWNYTSNVIDSIDTISLTVTYNPVTGRLYNEKNTYTFSNAYKVTLIPFSYSSSTLKVRVCVFNEMDVEHWWNMAYFLSDSVSFIGAPALNGYNNEYTITWQLKDWAEEYDLEWTWVDDYLDENTYKSPAGIEYNFRFNSGRVTIKGNTYKINPLFEHGYIIFRIRGVGYGGSDHRHRTASAWSVPYVKEDVQYLLTNYSKYTVTINSTLSHEPYLNWQYMATYAEEGKKKEVVSYFDGSLRNRQSVTKINSDTTAIAAETFYDYQGRAAVSALPVPTFSSRLSYYSRFNVNEFNLPYTNDDFDLDSTGQSCMVHVTGMDTTTGASRYYSGGNPFKNTGHHSYIPHALKYPFSQVEYTPDNTGRVSRQGGLGKDHQLGSGHETKYFYGTPDQGELERLFGTNVGLREHYRKNMVQDPNGQMSISYLDAKGKVIATALAGNTPTNVETLSSNSSSLFHTNLLEDKDSIYSESELVMDRKILVSADSTEYRIKYSVDNEKFSASCLSACYDCVYDLEISLTNICGEEKMPGGIPITRTIGRVLTEGVYDTLCHGDTVVTYNFKDDTTLNSYLGGTGNEYIKINLAAGEYHLVKKLKISTAALDYYTNKYIEQGLRNGCLLNQDSFIRRAYQVIDTTTCEMDCAKCRNMIGADTTFRKQYISAIIEENIVPTAYDTARADSIYELRIKTCDPYCDTFDPCRANLMIMLGHVTPGGQYAMITHFTDTSVFTVSNAYSIFALYNTPTDSNEDIRAVAEEAGLQYDTVWVQGERRCILDLTATELYKNWQPDWAYIFAKIHPEYCMYKWCLQNKASYLYDEQMLSTHSYYAALDSGYLNPLGTSSGEFIRGSGGLSYSYFPINNIDPFFEGNSTRIAQMRDTLEHYISLGGGYYLSPWETMVASNCVLGSSTSSYVTCLKNYFVNNQQECEDTIKLDRYWNIFRGMYLQKKRQYTDTIRNMFSGCNEGYLYSRFLNIFLKENFDVNIDYAFTTQYEALLYLGYTGGNESSASHQKVKARDSLNWQCAQQCAGYADRWMDLLGECVFADTSDKSYFKRLLSYVCYYGCDQNNPLGASTIAPKYIPYAVNVPVGTGYYSIASFEDVFNAFVIEELIDTSGAKRKCNINLIDFPGKYRHDYFLSSYNPLYTSAADTFMTSDSIGLISYDTCTCKRIEKAFKLWSDSADLHSCYDSVYKYVNYLFGTLLTEKETRAMMDACSYAEVSDCHQVILPYGDPTDTSYIPFLTRVYSSKWMDTVNAVVYKNDTVALPRVPQSLSCFVSFYKPPCLTCETMIEEAVAFIDNYKGNPDTAYALPQMYANIINREYGFNLSYYEFTRFLNTCDTIYKILFAVDYKSAEGDEVLPVFADALTQQVPMDFPDPIDEETQFGTCACQKLYNIYLTWVSMMQNKPEALAPDYLTFPPFAALNGFEVDEDYTIEELMDRCKEMVDIDSLVTRIISCDIDIICTNGLDTIHDCTMEEFDPGWWKDTIITCDTTYIINYCKILEQLPGPKRGCRQTVGTPGGGSCEEISDSLNKHPGFTALEAQEYLRDLYGGTFTVLKADYPLDPDTCTSNCTRGIFAVCGDLTPEAQDYFDILNEMAFIDTLDVEGFDLNAIYSFRNSVFNRSRNNLLCDGGERSDSAKMSQSTAPGVGGETNYDYAFTIEYDSAGSYCHVYFDTLPVSMLDSIRMFIDVRPATVYANGRQYFTFKVVMENGDTISGSGHTSCFMVSQCCPPTVKLCNRPLVTQLEFESPCKKSLKSAAIANGKAMYEAYIDSVRASFRQAWMNKCLQSGRNEVMEMEYNKREYNYILYHYDQAGNLVQTIPPAGVAFFNSTQINDAINIREAYPDSVYQPAHTLPTVYHYNSLNQLIWQRTPDTDTSEFFYDRLGRLTFSQNKKQKNNSNEEEIKYSYTEYDALGRIKEVGELRSPYTVTHVASRRQTFVEDSALTGTRSEITKTWYDAVQYSISNGSFTQRQMRGRVAHITYQDAEGEDYNDAVHYSYDIHGNVYSMVRENVTLAAIGQQYKQTDYDYDLVSGKVNQVSYQSGNPDQFHHRYEYDADNRLTNAYSSTDSVHWDHDAQYFYYLHGPLARTETGQHKVQGTDYAYTLHGWIKGVNSNTLNETRDMGKDGWVSGANDNRNVARDVFGFTLSYYNTSSAKDYTAINVTTITSSNMFEADLYSKDFGNASSSLFNGNIKSMVTAISKFMEGGATPMGYAYQYDQLNRLLKVEAYNNINCSTNTWNTGGSAMPDYHNRFSYDANGNILTQVRRGSAASGFALDSLTYHYASNKNQLTYVDDGVSGSAYTDDIDDQNSGNYEYDEIGNLIGDAQEQIDSIEWTLYGKIKRITRTNGSLKPDLEFEYTPDGHRVCKIVKPKVGNHIWNYTYYVRDAQGNIMATYDRTLEAVFDPEQTEYENVNAELVALNGAVAFKGFIQNLHPQLTSSNFIDSLKQLILDNNYELDFLEHFNPTWYLNANFSYYSYVYTAFDNDKLITGFYTTQGESSFLNSLYTHDAVGFVQYFIDQSVSNYLVALSNYDPAALYQMYQDAGGTPSTPPPGPGFQITYLMGAWSNNQIATWITSNGGFSLHYAIVQQYMNSLSIRLLMATYGNLKTAITAQYSTSDIIDAMVAYSGTYVWGLLHPSLSPGTLLGEVFSHEPAGDTYDVLVQYFWDLVYIVQDANYYYGKTNYFDEIKTFYGEYTYDVLVGKFIYLSNQFKDRFVLSEWHLYGSARLGIQEPKATTIAGGEASEPYGTSGGRELVHIEFEGSWSEYEVDFGDTSNTTVTTYQMNYDYYSLIRGEKKYELTNHLGNVMVVVSDKKLKTCTGDTVNYYIADILQASDYSAFGVILKGREYYADTTGKYRMGFNGKERDNEVAGSGTVYDYGFRIYNASLGRFLSTDPLTKSYPWYTPYQFAGNKPIQCIDIDGLEEFAVILWVSANGKFHTIVKAIKADGPLTVTYYVREQSATQPNPAEPAPGVNHCEDCMPRGVQPTDQKVVTKVVGQNGVTEENIWETSFQMYAAQGALESLLNGTEPARFGEEKSFDGIIEIARRTNNIPLRRFVPENILFSRENIDPVTGHSVPISDAKMNNFFSDAAKLDNAISTVFNHPNKPSGSTVTHIYVRTAKQKAAVESSLTRIGRSASVVIDKKKAAGLQNCGFFGVNFRRMIPKTVTTTSTTTTSVQVLPSGASAPTSTTTTP